LHATRQQYQSRGPTYLIAKWILYRIGYRR